MQKTEKIDEFDEFIKYAQTKWIKLAGISTLFPIANIVFNVIPLPVDAYGKSTAPIANPLTFLVCIFVIYLSFIKRYKYINLNPPIIFILGFISLGIFFLLDNFEYPLRTWLFPSLDSTSDYVLMLVGIVPFYILFFALVTLSFTILALIEFESEKNRKTKK